MTRPALTGCLLILLLAAWQAAPRSQAPPLAISGSRFSVSGVERFLLGLSLFDALGAVPPSDEQLDALGRWQIQVLRVWAHWSSPIYGADGALTPGGRARLLALVRRLEARGLILELVLLRPGQLPGQRFALFGSEAARRRAVRELAAALKPHRAILFDLYNEHDHPDGPIAHAEARALHDEVKAIDRDRLVSVSSTEFHFLGADGGWSDGGLENLRAEVGAGSGAVAVDFLAPHFPRTADWAAETRDRVAAVAEGLARVSRVVPIYLNEEQREGAGAPRIAPETYLQAARGAFEGGAAGWTFHTAAGYDLRRRSLLQAFSPRERAALDRLRTALTSGRVPRR